MDIFDDIARQRWAETEKTPQEVIDRFKTRGRMAAEAVLAMAPGRELNILVAKYVMGHDVVADEILGDMERLVDGGGDSVWHVLSSYSEDRETSQSVIDVMLKAGHQDAVLWELYVSPGHAAAETICKQALLAIWGSPE